MPAPKLSAGSVLISASGKNKYRITEAGYYISFCNGFGTYRIRHDEADWYFSGMALGSDAAL